MDRGDPSFMFSTSQVRSWFQQNLTYWRLFVSPYLRSFRLTCDHFALLAISSESHDIKGNYKKISVKCLIEIFYWVVAKCVTDCWPKIGMHKLIRFSYWQNVLVVVLVTCNYKFTRYNQCNIFTEYGQCVCTSFPCWLSITITKACFSASIKISTRNKMFHLTYDYVSTYLRWE